MVDCIDKGGKSSADLENVYDGIQNLETTDSDNVRDDMSQDDTLTLRLIKIAIGIW